MSRVVDLREPRLVFDLDFQPWIPEGRYQFAYVGHTYARMFKGRDKVAVAMRVINEGESFDTVVNRYYNVQRQGRNYRAKGSMDLNREFIDLFGKRALKDGIPWRLFQNVIVDADVRTVERDAQQRTLSDNNKYSVIRRLIGTLR